MEAYQKKKEELIKELGSRETGLGENEACASREKYGRNELAKEQRKSALVLFLEQFKDFLVLILIVAAVISGVLGDFESAVVILIVITINAVLGTVQNLRASRSLDSLRRLNAPSAKVLRGGEVSVIDASQVAVGDILVIEAGDSICADGRIIENASLKTDESMLTGESEPAQKEDVTIFEETPVGDRRNMVFSGSFAVYGRARAVVTAVGMNTELGKIASLLKNAKDKRTPLQISLDAFGKRLSVVILVVCAAVFGLGIVRGEPPVDAFVFAVALAVAAIPEALSSIVTVVLSMGTRKMAKENAVIRQLRAVEGLGSVSVICTDKTGTLTQNKMTVQKLFFDNRIIDKDDKLGEGEMQLVKAGALCSDAQVRDGREIGDPTETALIAFCQKQGMDADTVRKNSPRAGEIPFDSDRKLMSTVHGTEDNFTMLTKGAVDVLLPRIKEVKTADGKRDFTDEDAKKLREVNFAFSDEGLRVLAFCSKDIKNPHISVEDENGYTLMGLIAMQDPPRAESKAAVSKCIEAGIRPVMITGDHPVTAAAIAREIGILRDNQRTVQGSEIDKLSDSELDALVEEVSVYARVSPEHKIRIVEAWQRKGCIVSMTGDGVNDAPALKQADVGVAMGITGSEVAKDAASMVLTDDNFATIVKAVENGRNLYANIKRSIQFLLSGNAAAILAVVYASIAALPVPFKAVQLLFINLLTDSLPAIALGSEPHTSAVMHDKPRKKDSSVLDRQMLWGIVTEGLIIAAAAMAAFYTGLVESADKASTMAFSTLCLSRLVHGFNCKSTDPVWLGKRAFNNKGLIWAFLVGFVLLNAVLLISPLRRVFAVSALTLSQLVAVYGLSFGVFLAVQLLKTVKRAFGK